MTDEISAASDIDDIIDHMLLAAKLELNTARPLPVAVSPDVMMRILEHVATLRYKIKLLRILLRWHKDRAQNDQ